MLSTFLLVVVGWVFFRAESISQAFKYIYSTFNSSILSVPYLNNRAYYLPILSTIVLMIITEWINREKNHGLDLSGIKSHIVKFILYFALIVLIFWFGGKSETFIYFQF